MGLTARRRVERTTVAIKTENGIPMPWDRFFIGLSVQFVLKT